MSPKSTAQTSARQSPKLLQHDQLRVPQILSTLEMASCLHDKIVASPNSNTTKSGVYAIGLATAECAVVEMEMRFLLPQGQGSNAQDYKLAQIGLYVNEKNVTTLRWYHPVNCAKQAGPPQSWDVYSFVLAASAVPTSALMSAPALTGQDFDSKAIQYKQLKVWARTCHLKDDNCLVEDPKKVLCSGVQNLETSILNGRSMTQVNTHYRWCIKSITPHM